MSGLCWCAFKVTRTRRCWWLHCFSLTAATDSGDRRRLEVTGDTRPHWSIDHTEDPRAHGIIASELFHYHTSPLWSHGSWPFLPSPPSTMSINCYHRTPFIDCQRMGTNQSFFFYFSEITHPLVIYVNLSLWVKTSDLPAAPTNSGGVERRKMADSRLSLRCVHFINRNLQRLYSISQITVSHADPLEMNFPPTLDPRYSKAVSLPPQPPAAHFLSASEEPLAVDESLGHSFFFFFFQAVKCSLFRLGCGLSVPAVFMLFYYLWLFTSYTPYTFLLHSQLSQINTGLNDGASQHVRSGRTVDFFMLCICPSLCTQTDLTSAYSIILSCFVST